MRLTERVYLVGSGKSGADISNPYDSHVYLIDGASSLALIDAGVGIQPELILENIHKEGFDPENISHIVVTHGHADQAGGASALQTATGADVLAPGPAATWLLEANEAAISLPEARTGGTYPGDYRLAACATARAISDGDEIKIGDVDLQTIATPGHAATHVSFLLHGDDRAVCLEAILFSMVGKSCCWPHQTAQFSNLCHRCSTLPTPRSKPCFRVMVLFRSTVAQST